MWPFREVTVWQHLSTHIQVTVAQQRSLGLTPRPGALGSQVSHHQMGSQAERKEGQCPQAAVCAQMWEGEDDQQTAHDLAFRHCQIQSEGEPWVTEKPHRLWPKAAFGEMRRPTSMSPVGSCSRSMTSGTRKSPMENHRLELLPRHPLACVPRGCCLLHLSSELWAEVVPHPSSDNSPSSDIPGLECREGHVPGEFMGFSGWFFNRVLFVCCLVWGGGVGGVGSPRNVGLSSTEGLSGAEEGRRQMWRRGGF